MVDEKYYDEIVEPLAEYYEAHDMNLDDEVADIDKMKPFQIDRKDLPF